MEIQIHSLEKKWSGSNWQKYFLLIYVYVVLSEFVKDIKKELTQQ